MPRNLEPPPSADGPLSDSPKHMIGFLLKRLHHTLRQSVDEALRKQGLVMSFAHVASLFGLYYAPGSTGAQLARRAMVSAQTMNAALRRLEDDGFVERRPHPESRRADSWFLTQQGARQFARARAVGDEVFSRMLSALSPAEIGRLQDYLSRCTEALGECAPASAPAPRASRADISRHVKA